MPYQVTLTHSLLDLGCCKGLEPKVCIYRLEKLSLVYLFSNFIPRNKHIHILLKFRNMFVEHEIFSHILHINWMADCLNMFKPLLASLLNYSHFVCVMFPWNGVRHFFQFRYSWFSCSWTSAAGNAYGVMFFEKMILHGAFIPYTV